MTRLALVVLLASALPARAALDADEPAAAVWTNAVRRDLPAMCDLCRRVEPTLDCAALGTPAARAALQWTPIGSDASRFHSRHMMEAPCFQHDSCCTLEKTDSGEVRCANAPCSTCSFPTQCAGTDPFVRYGLLGYGAATGENIAAGQATSFEVVCAWLNSTGHRENILSASTEVAIGRAAGESSCSDIYWTQAFGSDPGAEQRFLRAAGVMQGSPGPTFGPPNASATALVSIEGAKAPRDVRVVIDGECALLERKLGDDARGLYARSLDLLPGCHDVWFIAHDADGMRHTFPEQGALALAIGDATCPDTPVRTPGQCEGDRGCAVEGATRPCDEAAEEARHVGVCHGGHETCREGYWGGCESQVLPQPERCNGLDDDCDGTVDEEPSDLGGSCVSALPGRCSAGALACIGGGTVCAPVNEPIEETCNGIDDDCDGVVDDGLGSLACGEGACRRVVDACVDGVPTSCVPGEALATDVCGNALDDDCDGTADEECPCTGTVRACHPGPRDVAGIGACVVGSQACVDGTWGPCVGAVLPSVETCNDLDDDCDGRTDEDLGQERCGTGLCATSAARCRSGRIRECVPMNADTEQCNGRDDSCDGTVDEGCACRAGTTTPCATDWSVVGVGVCSAGMRTCENGAFGACAGEVGPSVEACGNGVDDDCNGLVDDGCEPPPLNADAGCGCGSGGLASVAGFGVMVLLRRRRRDRAGFLRAGARAVARGWVVGCLLLVGGNAVASPKVHVALDVPATWRSATTEATELSPVSFSTGVPYLGAALSAEAFPLGKVLGVGATCAFSTAKIAISGAADGERSAAEHRLGAELLARAPKELAGFTLGGRLGLAWHAFRLDPIATLLPTSHLSPRLALEAAREVGPLRVSALVGARPFTARGEEFVRRFGETGSSFGADARVGLEGPIAASLRWRASYDWLAFFDTYGPPETPHSEHHHRVAVGVAWEH